MCGDIALRASCIGRLQRMLRVGSEIEEVRRRRKMIKKKKKMMMMMRKKKRDY